MHLAGIEIQTISQVTDLSIEAINDLVQQKD